VEVAVGARGSGHLHRCHVLLRVDLNFYEKALFVKTDVAAALCGGNANCSALRAMLLFALSGSSLFWWLGAYDEIRLFEPKALQSSERSSLRVDQVHLRSHLMLDPKRYLGQQPWPSPTSGRLAAVSWYLHLLFACLCSIASPFKQPPPALCADWRCRADRRPLR
jgi:hypothetical protein